MAQHRLTPPRPEGPPQTWVRAFAVCTFCHDPVTTFPALPSRHTYIRYIRPAQQTAPMGGEVNQQYPNQPQQPGWSGQPQQQWGQPTQPMWGAPPQPPKKTGAGKIIGLGCAGLLGFVVVAGAIGAVASSGGSKTSSSTSSHTRSSVSPQNTAKTGGSSKTGSAKTASKPAGHTVVFKVWGTAPAGALGGLDIQYGSDTDTRKGSFKSGQFTASLPFKSDAMYYQLNAQLQGSGDIRCSVTVDGHTKTGHASGGYNICMTQLNSGLFGDWS